MTIPICTIGSIKLLPVLPDPDLITDIERQVSTFGAIHSSQVLQPAA
jgi:hypothetical protein